MAHYFMHYLNPSSSAHPPLIIMSAKMVGASRNLLSCNSTIELEIQRKSFGFSFTLSVCWHVLQSITEEELRMD